MFLQQLLNGIVVGGVYALFAVGLTLIFGIHKILNLAHGGVFMASTFVALYAVESGLPLWLGVLLAIVAGGLLSVVVEQICFRPLRNTGEEEFGAIVSSIGANLILVTIAQQLTQTQILRFRFGTFPVEIYRFFGLRLSALQLFITVCAVVLVGLLAWYLKRTRFGKQIRAVAGNERAATLVGINPKLIYLQTFFLAGALAGAAGVLVGLAFNSIHFMMGEGYLLRAVIVIILGGLGSIPGALVAALLLGVVQTLSTAYLPTSLTDVVIFSSLFLILLVRPNGLFGRDEAGALRDAR
ncbi:amino acid/amide ABC transporter membrane protein 1, HAAT family [Tardiphaga sp. OK246]|nr:amino acid/amide ABC transporter membrane protein 1, HAAT family [Tardiphaga sp. OK246]